MRYLVLSDIHSNLEALEACVSAAKNAGYDKVLCCGDIVGYGPNPVEVIDLLEELKATSIRGNHDRVVAGITEPLHFNPAAQRAIAWTQDQLEPSYIERLAQLPVGPMRITERAQLVHGSERDEDEYVVSAGDVAMNLAITNGDMTFFGHTHEPSVSTRDARIFPSYDRNGLCRVPVAADKMLVNPGSVGQPRDGDSRASFLIWDEDADVFEFYRAQYAIGITQTRMREAGLPEILAFRLSYGR